MMTSFAQRNNVKPVLLIVTMMVIENCLLAAHRAFAIFRMLQSSFANCCCHCCVGTKAKLISLIVFSINFFSSWFSNTQLSFAFVFRSLFVSIIHILNFWFTVTFLGYFLTAIVIILVHAGFNLFVVSVIVFFGINFAALLTSFGSSICKSFVTMEFFERLILLAFLTFLHVTNPFKRVFCIIQKNIKKCKQFIKTLFFQFQ